MSDDEFTGLQKKILGWLLVAVVGGNTGVILLNKTSPDMRSDPFTGSEGRELQKQVNRIDAIQQTMLHRMQRREEDDRELADLIEQHLRRHP
jgi:hypothetical protein